MHAAMGVHVCPSLQAQPPTTQLYAEGCLPVPSHAQGTRTWAVGMCVHVGSLCYACVHVCSLCCARVCEGTRDTRGSPPYLPHVGDALLGQCVPQRVQLPTHDHEALQGTLLDEGQRERRPSRNARGRRIGVSRCVQYAREMAWGELDVETTGAHISVRHEPP